MALKLHLEKYPEWPKFDQESRSRANRVLGSLRNFRFLIVGTIMVKAPSYIKGPIKKIQGRSRDLYEVVDATRNTQTDLRLLRSEESDFYQRCYDYVIRICSLIGIEPSMPRITEKQVHRENTLAVTPYDYYRVNVSSPFLEHLSEGIDQRFDKCNLMTLRMMGLVPSVIAVKDEISISEAAEFYKDDLLCLNLLDEELDKMQK